MSSSTDHPAAPQPAEQFLGFDIPRQNWFKMPNNWTDITAKISSIAELKVVEYVLKHTWGYQEYGGRKRITNDEFMNGRRRKDGTRIDLGTGLSKPSVIAGLKAAVERGLLIEEVDDSDKARVKKYYSLRMLPDLQAETDGGDEPPSPPNDEGEGGGVKHLNAGVKDLYPEVKDLYPGGKTSLPRSEKDTLERHSKQDTLSNNNTSGETDVAQNDVVVALVNQGISQKVANRLANRYAPELVAEKIQFLEYLKEAAPEKVKTRQGWLRRAIEEDYAAPDGYRSPTERAAEAAEAQRQAEEREQAFEAQRRREEEKQEQHRQQEEARLAALQAQYGTTQAELDLWQKVLKEFESSMPAASFHLYAANTVLLSLRDGEALIGLPNSLAREWVENRLAAKIRRTLSSYRGGQKMTVQFIDLASAGATNGHVEKEPEPSIEAE